MATVIQKEESLPSLYTAALSNWLPMCINLLSALLLTPFLLSHIGKKDYGVWSLTLSFVGYYGLMQLSVGSGILRYVPFYAGRKDDEAASQIVSTGLAMFTVIGALILLISTLISNPLSNFYNGGHKLAILIRITGFAAAIECPMKILNATLCAREQWVTANLISVINGVMYATFLVIFILTGSGLIGMGIALILSDFGMLIFGIVALSRKCPEICLAVKLIRWSRIKELLAFGVLNIVGSAGYGMVLQNHKLLIGKLVSLEAVAIYAIATQLIERVRGIVWAPFQVTWPRFALLDGQKNHKEVISLFHQSTRYSSILASGAILLVILTGSPFIGLWLGQGFESSYAILSILGIGCLVEATLFGNTSFLGGTGRQGIQAIFSSSEAIGGFILSIILGWKMGLVGVAWGYTISVILIRGLIATGYICWLLKISPTDYYIGTLARPWVILIIITIICRYIGAPTYVTDWLSWLIFVFLIAVIYCFLTWIFVLNEHERIAVFEKARFMRVWIRLSIAGRKRGT